MSPSRTSATSSISGASARRERARRSPRSSARSGAGPRSRATSRSRLRHGFGARAPRSASPHSCRRMPAAAPHDRQAPARPARAVLLAPPRRSKRGAGRHPDLRLRRAALLAPCLRQGPEGTRASTSRPGSRRAQAVPQHRPPARRPTGRAGRLPPLPDEEGLRRARPRRPAEARRARVPQEAPQPAGGPSLVVQTAPGGGPRRPRRHARAEHAPRPPHLRHGAPGVWPASTPRRRRWATPT